MLMREIIECCKQSFCLCAVEVVASTLHIKAHDFWTLDGQILSLSFEPFASMTLPVIRGAAPLWAHRSEPDQPPQYLPYQCDQHASLSCIQLSREEKMAVYIGSEGDILIIVLPIQICPSSPAAFFEIRMKAGSPYSTLVACMHGQKVMKSLLNGIGLRLDWRPPEEVCQVFLSFDLVLTFIDGLSFRRPCDRVNFQGTAAETLLREPLLRLCS